MDQDYGVLVLLLLEVVGLNLTKPTRKRKKSMPKIDMGMLKLQNVF